MTPRHPLGMTPSALSLSADLKTLFVACSDANAAAVVDVSGDRSSVQGFIPTGWYPTDVLALSLGRPRGPQRQGLAFLPQSGRAHPARRTEPLHAGVTAEQYVARCKPARLPGSIHSLPRNWTCGPPLP